MGIARFAAIVFSTVARIAIADSYTWTDVTPSVPNMRATAIAVQPLDGRLACAKDRLVLLSTPDDVPRDLAVDRPADLIHEPL